MILHQKKLFGNLAPADLASVEQMIPGVGIIRSTGTRPVGTSQLSLPR